MTRGHMLLIGVAGVLIWAVTVSIAMQAVAAHVTAQIAACGGPC